MTVNVTLLGGGFGRKSKCDFVLEAALLSREMGGAPVKVVWTREDDIQHDYLHTVSLERIEAGIDAQGRVVAWRHRSVAPTIAAIFGPDPKHESPGELGMGLIDVPFDIPNLRCENGEAEAHTRIGWFRSVSNIPHGFAVQSFAAEIAHALGRDPKDVLLELIGPPRIVDPRKSQDVGAFPNYGDPFETYPIDTARLRRVVELVADQAEWGRKLPPGHGQGIAVHRSFLSYVATVDRGRGGRQGQAVGAARRYRHRLRLCRQSRAHPLADRGRGGDGPEPRQIRRDQLQERPGPAEQFRRLPGGADRRIPAITHVHIVPAGIDVPSSGVGEPGVPPFAPALCNAIFAATGKRIRRLPIGDQLAS